MIIPCKDMKLREFLLRGQIRPSVVETKTVCTVLQKRILKLKVKCLGARGCVREAHLSA